MAAWFCRLSPSARYSLALRFLHASSLPSHPQPLLAKLLRENHESGVRLVLDSEEGFLSRLQRDATFWAPLLSALRTSSPAKAQTVLEWKLEKLLKQDIKEIGCYCRLISLGMQFCGIQFVEQVFFSMELNGIRPNTLVFNSLISACLSVGDVLMSMNLFEIMEASKDYKPDLDTYNAFISSYSKKGDTRMMMGWYSARVGAGFGPDIQSYELLIAGFVKSGNFQEADRLEKEMASSGITPSVSVLECKLEGLCKRKKLSEIVQFLKFLHDGGWKLSEAMAEKLLNLYLDLGMVEELEKLLVLVENLVMHAIISQVHCGVVRLYALQDRVNDMESAIGRMLRKGIFFMHSDDLEAVICCYFRKEAYTRLDLFLERIRENHTLTRSTYDLLAAGYRRVGLQEQFDAMVKAMHNNGLN